MRLAAEMGVLFIMEQTLQTMGSQNNLACWAERVRACRSSGMSVKAWCAENGIVPNTYFRWQKKVYDAMRQEQGQAQFYEVPMGKSRCRTAVSIEVNGITASVYCGADEETVLTVLRAMRLC